MAKREEERKKNQDKFRRRVIINWIICGASLAAIIVLRILSKQYAHPHSGQSECGFSAK